MNSFNKFFGLSLLIIGSVVSFFLFLILVFYALKLFSFTVFNIPGFNALFSYVVTIIPFLIFLGGYYYLYSQTNLTKTNSLSMVSKWLLAIGLMSCFITTIIVSIHFFSGKSNLLYGLVKYRSYSLFAQLVILFVCSAIIAIGQPKEKDWMEKYSEK